jgi:glycylpeptide N-tetradecanoyltransferase
VLSSAQWLDGTGVSVHPPGHNCPLCPRPAGFRQIKEADYPAVTDLLNGYLSRYQLCQRFSEAELRHFLAPQDNLVHVYVVEDPASGKISDLVSFYCLPSSVLNHPEHTELKAAYMCASCGPCLSA